MTLKKLPSMCFGIYFRKFQWYSRDWLNLSFSSLAKIFIQKMHISKFYIETNLIFNIFEVSRSYSIKKMFWWKFIRWKIVANQIQLFNMQWNTVLHWRFSRKFNHLHDKMRFCFMFSFFVLVLHLRWHSHILQRIDHSVNSNYLHFQESFALTNILKSKRWLFRLLNWVMNGILHMGFSASNWKQEMLIKFSWLNSHVQK